MSVVWAASRPNSIIGKNPSRNRNTGGNGLVMETVQEEITKENKENDVRKVFDSINAVGLATSKL